MELFSEAQTDGRIAVIVAVSGIIGGAFTWLTVQLWKLHDRRKEERDREEKTITDHLNALIVRLDRDKSEKDEQIQKLQYRATRGETRYAALRAHVRYLESVLGTKGISFEKYEDPPDPSDDAPHSGTHAALTDATGPTPTKGS